MKKVLLLCMLALAACFNAGAQCTTANVNWDNLDFLTTSGNYAGFVTAAQTQDQRFAFGPGLLRVQTTSNITINGENTTNTGEGGSYGTGADVSFATTTTTGTSSVTLSFGSSAVTLLKFSLYDIDNNQKVTVTAFNGASAVSTTLTKATASSGINFSSNPGTAPVINGISGDYTVSDNRGAVNIDIAGPVTKIVLTFTTATGDFWLSDLQACVTGAFSTNYHTISQPWTGQPSYMTVTPDTNLVMTVNPANGAVKTIFQEPASMYVNSMGYDPFNHLLYYTLDDTATAVKQKSLKRYDFNTETIVPVLSDVTSIGIPIFDFGVESGAASFFDSCYYIGIEGGNSGGNSGRKSIVWRVEFDASHNPISASQVFAIACDNGSGTRTHDWGDFVIKDGILYDWNSNNMGTMSSPVYTTYQYNLQTAVLTTNTPMAFIPKQISTTWDEKLYQLSTVVRQYNGTTGYATTGFNMVGTGWVGGSGDGGEAFKPKADFGDAPATYDPGGTPALHEMDSTIHLGATEDREWLKEGATSLADADGSDEDAIGFVPLLCPCSGNFSVNVKVYNHTGANATLIGWLDWNGNNKFDASEALTATVTSSTALQTVTLNWTNAWTTYPNLATTYLRVRVTSASNGMTTANMTGYFSNGEVEDYRVFVNGFVLATNIQNFTASKTTGDAVRLEWKVSEDASLSRYFLQRSLNGKDWLNLDVQNASGKNLLSSYSYDDASLRNGTVYYRLQLMNNDGSSKLSDVRQITEKRDGGGTVWPNPASKELNVTINTSSAEQASIQVTNEAGMAVISQTVPLTKGANQFKVNVSLLAKGAYRLQMNTAKGLITQPFVKN